MVKKSDLKIAKEKALKYAEILKANMKVKKVYCLVLMLKEQITFIAILI